MTYILTTGALVLSLLASGCLSYEMPEDYSGSGGTGESAAGEPPERDPGDQATDPEQGGDDDHNDDGDAGPERDGDGGDDGDEGPERDPGGDDGDEGPERDPGDGGDDGEEGPERDPGDGDCKLEGADVGRVGASLTVGTLTVTFTEWFAKADEPSEYIGFRLSVDGLPYVVKAGLETFADTAALWVHPAGDAGPDAKAISNVDFCDGSDQPGDDDPGESDPGDDHPGDDHPPTGDEPGDDEPCVCTTDADCDDGEICGDDGSCVAVFD